MVNYTTRVFEPRTKEIVFDCHHLVPLIFPVIIGGLVYVAIKESESAKAETVQVLDESKLFTFTNSKRFTFVPIDMPLEQAKKVYNETQDFGLLYIPAFDINKPEGVALYTKENPALKKLAIFSQPLSNKSTI
jgi:ABC-2 type transport system permease protein